MVLSPLYPLLSPFQNHRAKLNRPIEEGKLKMEHLKRRPFESPSYLKKLIQIYEVQLRRLTFLTSF